MGRLNAPKCWLRLDTPDCNPSPTLSILCPHKVASWMQSLNSYRGPQSYTLKIEAVYQTEILVTLPHNKSSVTKTTLFTKLMVFWPISEQLLASRCFMGLAQLVSFSKSFSDVRSEQFFGCCIDLRCPLDIDTKMYRNFKRNYVTPLTRHARALMVREYGQMPCHPNSHYNRIS
jgi:hypothetical protein